MSSVTALGAPTQDEVAQAAGARAARVMGQVNALAFELVDLMVEVLDAEAWGGGGSLRSPVHWLCWRTGLSESRAKGLVAIAKRVHELPECVERFRSGRLTEDAMVLIASKAPAGRDRELAELAPMLLHSQLKRVLAHLPEQERRTTPRPGPALGARFGFQADGTWRGTFVLPADQGAVAQRALESAHQAVFAERAADTDPEVRGPVTWSDAYLRVSETALDALDPDAARTGVRGERAQVIVHLDARSDGDGQARIHLGPQLPDPLRRFLTCDAKVRAVLEGAQGAVLGISPQETTVNRRLRRIIEQRDGGCRYPGCSQTRWVQVHHIVHREDGGLTIASNLVCLCPHHHRAHHQGLFEITGNPEQPHGLRFSNRWGRAIGPPRYGPPAPPPTGDAAPAFTPPTGERLEARWFTWN